MSKHFRPDGIVLQPRDYDLLQGLYDSRLMTIKHATALHFEGKIDAAKKRLQKLQGAGMIVQRPRRPQDPAIYLLGREGYKALKRANLIDPEHDPGWARLYKRQRIGDLMLAHELAVMDVKVAFVTAIAKRSDLELVELSTSPERHKFRVVEAVPSIRGGVRFRSLYVKPDGFLRIEHNRQRDGQEERIIFVEVDRGTESHNRLSEKLRHYSQLRRRRGPKHPNSRMTDAPFQLLVVFSSRARLDNVVRKAEASSKRRMRWVRYAVIEDALVRPLNSLGFPPEQKQGDSSEEKSPL